eukprot:TRINITY_DN24904_c0_g1_i1.p1 TRINITY_DN24904_c0_g1~~TRINITY_DN24904_c0_g1_i1.p1  ORF type:complete len:306 (-),score=60.63 TRINITY_DN24904_c0_g1_i1:96-1013(-)
MARRKGKKPNTEEKIEYVPKLEQENQVEEVKEAEGRSHLNTLVQDDGQLENYEHLGTAEEHFSSLDYFYLLKSGLGKDLPDHSESLNAKPEEPPKASEGSLYRMKSSDNSKPYSIKEIRIDKPRVQKETNWSEIRKELVELRQCLNDEIDAVSSQLEEEASPVREFLSLRSIVNDNFEVMIKLHELIEADKVHVEAIQGFIPFVRKECTRTIVSTKFVLKQEYKINSAEMNSRICQLIMKIGIIYEFEDLISRSPTLKEALDYKNTANLSIRHEVIDFILNLQDKKLRLRMIDYLSSPGPSISSA